MNKDGKSLKAFTATAKSKADPTSAELVAADELDRLRKYQPINESVNFSCQIWKTLSFGKGDAI